ncbi:MAG: class I SAM-dependent methyltransferase [Pseudomonadota bacterium]
MTQAPLAETIRKQIAINGPLSVAHYMSLCLLDPKHGYYTQATPFGAQGDFITAPEISQLFGEIIGAWLINAWHVLGKPAPFLLVEAGPGRGTLMRDIARTARLDAAFRAAADLILIEASPKLRAVQEQTLQDAAIEARWLSDLDQLPDLPCMMVSNEFFDALPIRQFVKHRDQWLERVVGLGEDNQLQWQTGTASLSPASLPATAGTVDDGAIFEVSTAREAVVAAMAAHIAKNGGIGLHFDYGHATSAPGDTFQAVHRHAFVDPLDTPGQADLTSHVDFEALARSAKRQGVHPYALMDQGDFLLRCGLLERAGQLGDQKPVTVQQQITADVKRLAGDGPDDMGELFKAFCFAHEKVGALPPFAA